MEILEAIHTRQSIGKVKADPVPREFIERILSAAVQAPNHHKVRPWRFVVMTGAARERLGEVMAHSLRNSDPTVDAERLMKERAKPLRAPLVIAVGVDRPNIPKVVEIENVCAAAAAVQNMLLAAHGHGLAAYWRTGAAATDPAVKAFLGFDFKQTIIGFIYIGYPDSPPNPHPRPSFEDRTIWME